MDIAIFGKKFEEKHIPAVQQLFDELAQVGKEMWICEEFHQFLSDKISYAAPKLYSDQLPKDKNFKCLISIGGDGTLLNSISIATEANLPILGINTGRLGFLSSIGIEHFKLAWDAVLVGNYKIDNRALLQLYQPNGLFNYPYALNEITIQKTDSSSMITIETHWNGEYVNTYWADGLIISTSTGSTAYSLSCGGPIIMPASETFVITPIAPHHLNVRPLVIPQNGELELKVTGRMDNFLLAMDSRSIRCETTYNLRIKRADFKVQLVQLPDQSFLTAIQNKMMWGLDTRN